MTIIKPKWHLFSVHFRGINFKKHWLLLTRYIPKDHWSVDWAPDSRPVLHFITPFLSSDFPEFFFKIIIIALHHLLSFIRLPGCPGCLVIGFPNTFFAPSWSCPHLLGIALRSILFSPLKCLALILGWSVCSGIILTLEYENHQESSFTCKSLGLTSKVCVNQYMRCRPQEFTNLFQAP